jgi:hypothetical protein
MARKKAVQPLLMRRSRTRACACHRPARPRCANADDVDQQHTGQVELGDELVGTRTVRREGAALTRIDLAPRGRALAVDHLRPWRADGVERGRGEESRLPPEPAALVANQAVPAAIVANQALAAAIVANQALAAAIVANQAVPAAIVANQALAAAIVAHQALATAIVANQALAAAIVANQAVPAAIVAHQALVVHQAVAAAIVANQAAAVGLWTPIITSVVTMMPFGRE